MLHRMALRVLPSLSLAVTESSVRKKKRIVMFVPGLVAFAVYRLAKLLLPLSEPIVLLAVSGLVSLVTALFAYRVGRATGWGNILREDGNRLLAWLGGWIGFVYGVQLSLLVLALLWLVGAETSCSMASLCCTYGVSRASGSATLHVPKYANVTL